MKGSLSWLSHNTFTWAQSTFRRSTKSSSTSRTWPKHSPMHMNIFFDHAWKGIPSKRIQAGRRDGPRTSVHLSNRRTGESSILYLIYKKFWNSTPEKGFTQKWKWFSFFTETAPSCLVSSYCSISSAVVSQLNPKATKESPTSFSRTKDRINDINNLQRSLLGGPDLLPHIWSKQNRGKSRSLTIPIGDMDRYFAQTLLLQVSSIS